MICIYIYIYIYIYGRGAGGGLEVRVSPPGQGPAGRPDEERRPRGKEPQSFTSVGGTNLVVELELPAMSGAGGIRSVSVASAHRSPYASWSGADILHAAGGKERPGAPGLAEVTEDIYIYIYIYTHTHTHMYIYIYIYI